MLASRAELDIEKAAQSFATLGSEARLEVVKMLVRAGRKQGLTIGDIQSRTGMATLTLAHHLKFLKSAGLIEQEKTGRSVLNWATFERIAANGSLDRRIMQ